MSNSLSALALVRSVDAALKAARHEYRDETDVFLGALHDAGFEVVERTAAPNGVQPHTWTTALPRNAPVPFAGDVNPSSASVRAQALEVPPSAPPEGAA